jgi:ribosomal protein L34E
MDKILITKIIGGKYVAQYISKTRKGPICGDCKISLPGVSYCNIYIHQNHLQAVHLSKKKE